MLTPKQYRHLTELLGSNSFPDYKAYLDCTFAGRDFALNRLFKIDGSGHLGITAGQVSQREELEQALGIAKCARAGYVVSNRCRDWLRRIARRHDVMQALERLE